MMLSPQNAAKSVCVLLAATVAAVSGCDLIPGISAPQFKGQKTATAEHVAGAPLRVETTNGSITVTKGGTDEVQIVGRIKAVSQERLDAAEIVATRGDDQSLFVHVEWPGGRPRNNEGCSLEVVIPDAVGVTLRTKNGNASVSDLAGPAMLNTHNGSVSFTRHAGPIEGHTHNGNVIATAAGGAVTAASSNGSIKIELTPDSAGPIDAETTNGSIDLAVGPALVGVLELSTTNGSVKFDESVPRQVVSSSRTHAELSLGESKVRSRAKTTNGAVRVRTVAATPSPATS